MEEKYKRILLQNLNKDWEYIDDIKIQRMQYAVCFRHKQTQIIKLHKVRLSDSLYSSWWEGVNEALRVFEYRKWRKAVNMI